jgi:hypothetical protein
MPAPTASILTATNLVRAWIVGGLGTLVLLVIFMIQPPTAASAATAARPCATAVSSVIPCQKCSPGQKCSHCPKCTPCLTASGCCHRAA